MPKKPPKPKPSENVLYVVLHGLITLIDEGKKPKKKTGFIAYLLDVGDDHKYLLGDWLSELDITQRKRGWPPRRSKLHGVNSGEATLDGDLNAVAKLDSIPSDSCGDVREVFRLPRPRCIRSLIKGKIQPNGLVGTAKLIQQPTHLTGVQVFEYTFTDKDNVFLMDDHGHVLWKPGVTAKVETEKKFLEVLVLHVYDEPPLKMKQQQAEAHNRREFGMSASVLQSDLDLAKPTFMDGLIQLSDLPPGLLLGEVMNLHKRIRATREILVDIREQDDISLEAGGGSAGPVCGGMHATT